MRERLQLLRQYEQRVTPHVWSLCPGERDDSRTLVPGVHVSEWLAPLPMVISSQILSHPIVETKGNNLPQPLLTDFGAAMMSNTQPGAYA